MTVVTAHLPDQHHFRGSFGGNDIIPLYLDTAGRKPNVATGLLPFFSAAYGFEISAEDLAAYVHALLGGQSYTERFWNELETPGPRVLLTRNPALFQKVAQAGQSLIHLHTFGERFGDWSGIPEGEVEQRGRVGDRMPEAPDYDPEARELRVGDATWSPVSPEVWDFEVSGLKVLQSWLGYRMKNRSGRTSSPLDDIRPERWDAETTREPTHLLRILEETLRREPTLRSLLDAVVGGEVYKADELPRPIDDDCEAPEPSKEERGKLL